LRVQAYELFGLDVFELIRAGGREVAEGVGDDAARQVLGDDAAGALERIQRMRADD